MERAEKIRSIIKERSELHINDPSVQKYWDSLTDELSKDEQFTISFLNVCRESDIFWISEVFEDISARLNSAEYIKCLQGLDDKFPDLKLSDDIQESIEFMS